MYGGSYVDVHDNEVVNLNIDKATVTLQDGDAQERAAAQLWRSCARALFWNVISSSNIAQLLILTSL